MLVLSRKSMERIQIGDNVVVTILEIRGNKVRLGIEAPKEIHVVRAELQDKIAEPTTGVGPIAVASTKAEAFKLIHIAGQSL